MWRSCKFLRRSVCAALALACGATLWADAGPGPAVEPFTYLYDVPRGVGSRIVGRVAAADRRVVAPGGRRYAHRFEGCPVLVNDKIVAVLRKDSRTSTCIFRRG